MHASNLGRTPRQSSKIYRAMVERAWEAMAAGHALEDSGVRELVSASWRRCLDHGVAPVSQLPPCAAADGDLGGLHAANHELLEATRHTWRLLTELLDGTHGMLLVTDPRGVILDITGNPSVIDKGAEVCISAGYQWSEDGAGTNAVGTAIAIGKPAEVDSVEHFCAIAKSWACAAVPVRDSLDGSLVGVIDVTTFGHGRPGHSLALATTAAHQVEQALRSRELARTVQLLQWYQSNFPRWSHQALMLLDRKGRFITSNGHAQSLFRDSKLLNLLKRGAPLMTITPGAAPAECLETLPAPLRALALEGYGGDAEWQGGLLVLDGIRRSNGGAVRPGSVTTPRDAEAERFRAIVGDNVHITDLKTQAQRAARTTSPVLLLGETGTGKELFAHTIHHASARAAGPFIAVKCATLDPELAASQLLGCEGGAAAGALPRGSAGKFEEADGGTLFLDDVGELPLAAQAHLLRLLQDDVVVRVGGSRERKVSVRIIAATHQDLESLVAAGRFRHDLYFRLRVLLLAMPPLRARRSDVGPLAERIIEQLNERYGFGPKRLSEDLLQRLEAHDWPGNVRQLEAIIESMYVLCDHALLEAGDLPPDFAPRAEAETVSAAGAPATIASLEREAILRELGRQAGNRARVARVLGISRSTLYRKLVDYGIA